MIKLLVAAFLAPVGAETAAAPTDSAPVARRPVSIVAGLERPRFEAWESRTQWRRGALIGAGIGGAALLGASLYLVLTYEDDDGCGGCGTLVLAATGAGLIGGALIGATVSITTPW